MRLRRVSLAVDLAESFPARPMAAYERLLQKVVEGNLTLFRRRDALDAARSWIDPIRNGWLDRGDEPKSHSAGSWGRAAATSLIGRGGYARRDES